MLRDPLLMRRLCRFDYLLLQKRERASRVQVRRALDKDHRSNVCSHSLDKQCAGVVLAVRSTPAPDEERRCLGP